MVSDPPQQVLAFGIETLGKRGQVHRTQLALSRRNARFFGCPRLSPHRKRKSISRSGSKTRGQTRGSHFAQGRACLCAIISRSVRASSWPKSTRSTVRCGSGVSPNGGNASAVAGEEQERVSGSRTPSSAPHCRSHDAFAHSIKICVLIDPRVSGVATSPIMRSSCPQLLVVGSNASPASCRRAPKIQPPAVSQSHDSLGRIYPEAEHPPRQTALGAGH